MGPAPLFSLVHPLTNIEQGRIIKGMDTRPLNPEHWPLTEARPVPSVIRRLIAIKKELKRSNFGPHDRIALMVNATDVEELITALTRARATT